MCLPMGYTLSCYYFEAISTFLNWIIDQEISNVGLCWLRGWSVALFFLELVECLNTQIHAKKISVYPSTCIDFLGITINSVTMEFYLPDTKNVRNKSLLAKLLSAKKTTLRELQSLLGLLVFTARVIPMGRVFSKRLYRATCGIKSPFAHIRITKPIKFGCNSSTILTVTPSGRRSLSILQL